MLSPTGLRKNSTESRGLSVIARSPDRLGENESFTCSFLPQERYTSRRLVLNPLSIIALTRFAGVRLPRPSSYGRSSTGRSGGEMFGIVAHHEQHNIS